MRRLGQYVGALVLAATLQCLSAPSSRADPSQLDSITVNAKKEREKLRHEVDRFVRAAMARNWDESFK